MAPVGSFVDRFFTVDRVSPVLDTLPVPFHLCSAINPSETIGFKKNMDQAAFGGIEAGGTKFVCAIGKAPNDLITEIQFPTATPQETLQKTINFFQEQARSVRLKAIGIGSFGPVDLNHQSPTYGFITSTPKPGWAFTDFAGTIARALQLPVAFDTDVNAAAFGEHIWGAAQGLDTFIYLTVGTGIGGGGLIRGLRMAGLVHPEMGHLLLPRAEGDSFEGICPYHGDCLEGMTSGPAIEKRWGTAPKNLPSGHQAWEFEAFYLAHALANYIFVVSPQRIILGGGVMQQEHLFTMIRQKVQKALNGYVQASAILENIEVYIVPPGLGKRSGVLGAIALAREAAGESSILNS